MKDEHPLAQQLIGYATYHHDSPEDRKDLFRDHLLALVRPKDEISADPGYAKAFQHAYDDIHWLFNGEFRKNREYQATVSEQVFSELAQENDLAAWLLADRLVVETFETTDWRQPDPQSPGLAELRGYLAHSPKKIAWLALRATTDEVPIEELWKEVRRSAQLVQTCVRAPESAAVARLFYHASRRTVVDGNLKAFIAEFKRYPFQRSGHARKTLRDAVGICC